MAQKEIEVKLFPGTKLEVSAYPAFMAPFMTHDLHFTEASRVDSYMPLEQVLLAAYAQASMQKGKERHAQGDVFLDQPIISIGQLLKSPDGEAYQAIKKVREGLMMHRTGESERCIREILGAINYLAATAILVAEESHNRGIREFEEQQRVFEPDNFSAAIAAAEITVDELATLMSLREGTSKVVLVPSDSWYKADAVFTPVAEEVEILCPDPGTEPTREQLIRALELHNPNIPDYALDHLWGGDVQPPISEMYGLMADEYLGYLKRERPTDGGKRLKQGRRTETIRITTAALASWRVETFGDDDSGV